MNIHTGQVITGYNVKNFTFTDLFNKYTEAIPPEQEIKTLKIKGKKKVPLYPIDWIAVVDYDEGYNDDNEIDTNQNKSEDEEYKDEEKD